MKSKFIHLAAAIFLTGFMAGAVAADLPPELANVPKSDILDMSGHLYGTKVDDPESARGKAVAVQPAKDAKKYPGILMGVYDKEYMKLKKNVVAISRYKAKDEKYHWYQIKRAGDSALQGTPDAVVYLENWKIGARLPNLKGKYDFWISVKAQGPYYVDGSRKENKLFLDQVLLVPVK